MTKVIYVDGACSGNPGPMRIAIFSDNFNLRIVKDVGDGTNNRAEYIALIYALTYAKHLKEPVTIKSDSQLVVNQMLGDNNINDRKLVSIQKRAMRLLSDCKYPPCIEKIPREENIADSLFH